MPGASESGMRKTGERFGKYVVYEQLGSGGMAVVQRATWSGIEGFERELALKRLHPQLGNKPEVVAAFVREAKLSARLQHVSIAHTYELGKVGDTYFIAQELIDGRDLKAILRRASIGNTPVPIAVLVWILAELCEALDYTHTRADTATAIPLGIVHRDISPSNVMVTRTGHVKVIDFGVAEALVDNTYSGGIRGKYGYMSPEALAQQPLDARSDLYSVGVVAHELIVGDRLFTKAEREARSRGEMLDQPLPPSLYRRDCPRELDQIVVKALASDRNERWGSASALREALHSFARRNQLEHTSSMAAEWFADLFAEFEDDFTIVEMSEWIADMTTEVNTPPVR